MMNNDIEQMRAALTSANRQNADYAAALDFVGRLTQATTEPEAITKILHLFTTLFCPGKLSYLLIRHGSEVRLHSSSPDDNEEALKARLENFKGDWAWTPSGHGFILRISHQDETVGVLEVDALQFPEFREQYLNLSLALRNVCGLAIANARIYQRLEETLTALKEANAELEAFSYSVSHDLKTPLRGIDGFSNIILKEYGDKLDPRGREYLEIIRKSSKLMAQLIDDILSLSRITRAEIRFKKVNLSALAQMAAEQLKQTQPERYVEFVIAPGLTAYGDERLLKLVFENLMGNAFKFTGRCSLPRIEFGVTQEGNEAVYFVRDNGTGFNMAYVNKLFNPFQRLHTAEEFPGTGVGLASVQRIIRRHDGRVWAEGKVDAGATFYFTLPPKEQEDS